MHLVRKLKRFLLAVLPIFYGSDYQPSTMAIEYLKVVTVVLAYWTISISMVFANKYLLGDRDSSADISLYVAWVQCVVSVLLVAGNSARRGVMRGDWGVLSNQWKFLKCGRKGTESSLSSSDPGPFQKPILMMTCTYVGMLSFNNLCLKNVGVAFYQVARSLTLIFVVIFSVILLKKSVSWKVVTCCLIVAGGFVLGVDQENLSGTLSAGGVVFGIITSLFVSLNGIFTKTALDAVERDSVKLTFYNNINAIILFLPFVLFTGQFRTAFTTPQFLNPQFIVLLLMSGGLGFLIAWISAVQIDITSPVTHHISANAKAVLQTLIAVLHSGATKGALWWLSILMVVGGALFYALARMQEERQASSSASTQPSPSKPPNGNGTVTADTISLLEKGELDQNARSKRERSNTR